MKSAIECMREAERCEALAQSLGDTQDRRVLIEAAAQWRKLAEDAANHERMTAISREQNPK
jgi:hypothetical protein